MAESNDGSVTRWLVGLKGDDGEAPDELWRRYSRRLVGLARKRLGPVEFGVADEEDVALSAFDSFCRGAKLERFRRLEDRDDLWQLLVVITVRKAANLVEQEQSQKRGGGRDGGRRQSSDAECERIVGREPSPELAVMAAEQCRHLLLKLPDQSMRSIALLRMEGFTDDEIAQQLGCARRTVQRRVQLIKDIWEHDVA